jgi:prevent-host-death family protein
MKLSESVKPISYLKSHTSKLIRDVSETGKTLVITQNGEAKAIIQDLASYEKMADTISLLKILAMSSKSKVKGHFKPINKAFEDISKRIKELK